MILLAKSFGFMIAAFGLVIFASPSFTGKIFAFFKEGKRLYLAGAVRLAAGLVLLLAASQSAVPIAAVALGVMFLVSGIVVFAADMEKLKAFMESYSRMPGLVLRLLGLAAACFGVLIISIF